MIGTAAFALALVCAAVFGLAIQRGSTCTVAAVQEWRSSRRLTRLTAMTEASIWVCAALLLARQAGHPVSLPPGHALSGWTLAGAALLGLGAVVNEACVFGTVARLGSGQWAHAATPLGFYLGCAAIDGFRSPALPVPLASGSPLGALPAWVAWMLLAGLLVRAASAVRRLGAALDAPWSPHAATLVIGIAFAILLMVAGAWSYTDVLAELAHGMAPNLPGRSALCASVLFGALAGGWMTGQISRRAVTVVGLLRCLVGGLLMGSGSVLIPGGNDGLVLLGMPMLWPYAWAAFGVMLVVIALALRVTTPR